MNVFLLIFHAKFTVYTLMKLNNNIYYTLSLAVHYDFACRVFFIYDNIATIHAFKNTLQNTNNENRTWQ